jgi:hypothetical protein
MKSSSPSLFEWARTKPVVPVNPKARPLGEACEEVRRIWEVLDRDCRGIGNARTAAVLGELAGIKLMSSAANRGRVVRDLIARHIDDFPAPVLALTGNPVGYFIPESPAEMERGHVVVHSRQVELAARDRGLVRQGKAMGWEYQGKGRWS